MLRLKIHSAYGPGLFESVYEAIMTHELTKRGLRVSGQQPIPLVHENIRMGQSTIRVSIYAR